MGLLSDDPGFAYGAMDLISGLLGGSTGFYQGYVEDDYRKKTLAMKAQDLYLEQQKQAAIEAAKAGLARSVYLTGPDGEKYLPRNAQELAQSIGQAWGSGGLGPEQIPAVMGHAAGLLSDFSLGAGQRRYTSSGEDIAYNPDVPSDVRAVQMGMEDPRIWSGLMALKNAGAGRTTINMPGPAADLEYAKQHAQLEAKSLDESRTKAQAAAGQIKALDMFDDALNKGTFSGKGVPVMTALAHAGRLVGIPSSELANTETAQAASARLVQEMMSGMTQVSDADRAALEQAVASVHTDPEAAKTISRYARRYAEEQIGNYSAQRAFFEGRPGVRPGYPEPALSVPVSRGAAEGAAEGVPIDYATLTDEQMDAMTPAQLQEALRVLRGR